MSIVVEVDPEVESLGVYLWYAVVEDVDNRSPCPGLEDLIRSVLSEVRSRLRLEDLRDHPHVRPFRDLYWRLGIDPTKQRPAHEALLRRVLRGEDLPRVSPVVDIGNIVSIRHVLPVGMYDLDKVKTTRLRLRFAREGETVKLLGAGERRLTKNQIVLAADDQILHVFPHRDSENTAITPDTKRVLIVVAALDPIPQSAPRDCIQEILQHLHTYTKAKTTQPPTTTKPKNI